MRPPDRRSQKRDLGHPRQSIPWMGPSICIGAASISTGSGLIHRRENALPILRCLALESSLMSTFLLIHGAWHGGWCWRKVAPLLQAKAHMVLAPDLPGHGNDKTPTATVTLQTYTDRICLITDAQA